MKVVLLKSPPGVSCVKVEMTQIDCKNPDLVFFVAIKTLPTGSIQVTDCRPTMTSDGLTAAIKKLSWSDPIDWHSFIVTLRHEFTEFVEHSR